MQGYSTSNLLMLEKDMDKLFNLLLDRLDKFANSQQPMDLDKFFTFTAADITGELLCSKPFGFLREGRDIDHTLARSHKIIGLGTTGAYFPWLGKLVMNPFVTWTGLLPFRLIYTTAMTAIKERRANPDAHYDILTHWFKAHQEGKVTLRDVEAQTTLGIVAGTDAMSTGWQSFVYHMIRTPAVWSKARDEIKESVAQGKCRDRVVSFADAQELPYLQACIKEALRFFGPLGTGLPRVVPKDGVKLGSRIFPEGTSLSIHP